MSPALQASFFIADRLLGTGLYIRMIKQIQVVLRNETLRAV